MYVSLSQMALRVAVLAALLLNSLLLGTTRAASQQLHPSGSSSTSSTRDSKCESSHSLLYIHNCAVKQVVNIYKYRDAFRWLLYSKVYILDVFLTYVQIQISHMCSPFFRE